VNKEQVTDRVGVVQPTCIIIHEEYDWELEYQHSVKDDSLPSKTPSFFPDIFGEPSIHYFACISSSMDAPIFYHSQDTLDFNPSFDNREDKLFIENPLDLSSAFSRNTKDGFFCFSFTPLFDSSDHEDANEIVKFYDHSYCDPFTPIFNHDHDSIVIDFSKPLVYDDEVETPKTIEAL